MEKAGGESKADAQKEAETEAEQMLAASSPGPSPPKYTPAFPGNIGNYICSSA